MAWDDIQTIDDCITYSEWNNMVTQIELNSVGCPSKASLDFYLYSDCSDLTGQKFKFTYSGDESQIIGSPDTGDDLGIYANDTDSCSWAVFYGNDGIQMAIAETSTFEISTCSLETLFEIDNSTPSDKHVDFHCLDAHNFVLELRTTNPSSPTCLGQIWFRTDLV